MFRIFQRDGWQFTMRSRPLTTMKQPFSKVGQSEVDRMLERAELLLQERLAFEVRLELKIRSSILSERHIYRSAVVYISRSKSGLAITCHDGYRDRARKTLTISEFKQRFIDGVYMVDK